MFAASSPSEPCSTSLPRCDGSARVTFKTKGNETCLSDLYQSDPCRVLFPNPAPGAPVEAVFVTTSGGIAGGDRLSFEVGAAEKTRALVTTQAAEKIYRSLGPDAEIDVRIEAGPDSCLEWMPQETILFNDARLNRRNVIDLSDGAAVLAGEIVFLGRLAMGETVATGFLQDRWEIRHNGKLIWADAFRLDGDIAAARANRFGLNGATAMATLVYCANDAQDSLQSARDILAGLTPTSVASGATALDRLLIIRFLGNTPSDLRLGVSECWAQFRSRNLNRPSRLPRVWET